MDPHAELALWVEPAPLKTLPFSGLMRHGTVGALISKITGRVCVKRDRQLDIKRY